MKYTAKILTPSGRIIKLGADEVDNLVLGVAADGLLTCLADVVEYELGADAVDVLACSDKYAVWGLENAADLAVLASPRATEQVEKLTGQPWRGDNALHGPILIVEAK